MSPICVHLLPELAAAEAISGSCCVVIDVLRATTTIVEALAAGAKAVAPCLSIEDARRTHADLGPAKSLLGGERGGKPIDGFDLGNSPAEYTPAQVRGRTVVLTTTNGTKALLYCRAASETLVAGFVNLNSVVERLREVHRSKAIHLVCAGTDGHMTREDVLVAGAIVAGLHAREELLCDPALLARDAWLHVAGDAAGAELVASLTAAMRASRGGRNLIEIGMAGDIELAARVDRHSIVPRFDAQRGQISRGTTDA